MKGVRLACNGHPYLFLLLRGMWQRLLSEHALIKCFELMKQNLKSYPTKEQILWIFVIVAVFAGDGSCMVYPVHMLWQPCFLAGKTYTDSQKAVSQLQPTERPILRLYTLFQTSHYGKSCLKGTQRQAKQLRWLSTHLSLSGHQADPERNGSELKIVVVRSELYIVVVAIRQGTLELLVQHLYEFLALKFGNCMGYHRSVKLELVQCKGLILFLALLIC